MICNISASSLYILLSCENTFSWLFPKTQKSHGAWKDARSEDDVNPGMSGWVQVAIIIDLSQRRATLTGNTSTMSDIIPHTRTTGAERRPQPTRNMQDTPAARSAPLAHTTSRSTRR